MSKDFRKYQGQMDDFDPGDQAPIWEPEEPGDSIVGAVVSIQRDLPPYGTSLLTMETDNGEKAVWLKEVLKSGVKRNNVKVGDIIGIKFAGKEQNKSGTYKYDNYGIKVFERSEDREVTPF